MRTYDHGIVSRKRLLILVLLGVLIFLGCSLFSRVTNVEPNLDFTATITRITAQDESEAKQADIGPEPTLTNSPTSTLIPTPTDTPLPPRVDKWVVSLAIEMEEKREVGGAQVTTFKDTVTYDSSFIVLRGEIKGTGTGHHEPVFAPGIPDAVVEDINCPEMRNNVKGTLISSSASLELIDRAGFTTCDATVSSSSFKGMLLYGSQLTAILEEIPLELLLQDGWTIEGSGVIVKGIDELTGETYDFTEPMAYSYQARIEAFDPTTAAAWPTPIPTLSPTPTTTAPAQITNATAPSSLPESNTSEILEADSCFDFDEGIMTSGESCDLKFMLFKETDELILGPVNGAFFTAVEDPKIPPSLAICRAGEFDIAGYVDYQDRYLCFKTNEGYLGFFVLREHQREQESILFDWWVFPSISEDHSQSLAQPEPTSASTEAAALIGTPEIMEDETLVQGQCFDFDRGEAITDDGRCDLTYVHIPSTGEIMISSVNGTVFLTIADFGNPPTPEMCQDGNVGTGNYIGIQGRYLCFVTQEDAAGAFLLKEYQAQEGSIIFDWWMFP